MSDTDDTDSLLLIPPDLFAILTDTEDIISSPYYKVVEGLITQVSNLENRINVLSSTSESSISHLLDYSNRQNKLFNAKLMSAVRKYSSLEYLPVDDSILGKQRFEISSLPATPNTKSKTNSKKQCSNKNPNETLNEIDTFISNVKTIQKFQSARSLCTQFNALDLLENSEERLPEGTTLNDIKETDNVEKQQRDIKIRLQDEEIEKKAEQHMHEVTRQEYDTHSLPNPDICTHNFLYDYPHNNLKCWNLSNKNSISTEDSNLSNSLIKPLNNTNICTLTTTGIFDPQNLSNIISSNTETFSESRTISNSGSNQTMGLHSNTIRTNAIHALDMHNKLCQIKNEATNENKRTLFKIDNENAESRFSDCEPSSKNALVMMKLSDLWNSSEDIQQLDKSKILNIMQEENLRRQYCEQLIQKLQITILELQEKLSVALEIDAAKEEAILEIHKSWEETIEKIDGLRTKNTSLENVIFELQHKLSQQSSEISEKIVFYEKESSKALNLAHNSQERLMALEKENNDLSTRLQALKNLLKDTQDSYNVEKDNVKQLSNMLHEKDDELKENKLILSDARKEISQSKKIVEFCQTELTSMRLNKTDLEHQLNDKLNCIREIESDKSKILVNIEMHKKIEKSLRDELNQQKEKMDHHKLELRNFYQNQVEVLVQEKLREFQVQLEKAENSLQEKLNNRELTVAKAAVQHIQQITEKHALEIHLIEEKHKEEIKLYTLQLSKAQQQIDTLQTELQEHQERKTHIAQQLHKVMEDCATKDQLTLFKTESNNAVEKISFRSPGRGSGDYKNLSAQEVLSTSMQTELEQNENSETCLIAKSTKSKHQLNQEMQQHIQKFSKSSGISVKENLKRDKTRSESPETGYKYNFQNNFEKIGYGDGVKCNSKTGQKDRLGKPPWK